MQVDPLEEKFLKDFCTHLDEFPEIGFIDWKIFHALNPGIDDGFDVFKWGNKFEAVVGVRGDEKLDSAKYSEKLHNIIKKYSKDISEWAVSHLLLEKSAPWNGFTQSITIEKIDHPLLDIPPDNQWKCSQSYSFQKGVGRKIVGVLQVKDADMTIEKVLNNFLPLVDWLVILENGSTDSTKSIIKEKMQTEEKILYREILNVESGGRYLDSLCSTDTLVIRIDSDEIWDPEKAALLRNHLLNHDFSNCTKLILKNSFLHVRNLDFDKKTCSGKIADHDIHYFGNIVYWHQNPERLHGLLKILRNKNGQNVLVKDGESIQQEVDVGTCLVLHFPFLRVTSNPHPTFKKEWDQHKQNYISDSENQFSQSFESFGITDLLEKIIVS